MSVNMALKFVLLSVFLFIVLFIWDVERDLNADCDNFKRIASDEKILNSLREQIKYLFDHPEWVWQSGYSLGPIMVESFDHRFGVDWDLLGVPIEYAMIQFNGSKINYKELSWANVETVTLSYGYRELLDISKEWLVSDEETLKAGDVTVTCQ